MQQGGKLVPQSAIFDIEIRSYWKKTEDALGCEIDRLWVRQIPNFILGYHQYGVFNDIEVKDVWEQILQWEQDHVEELRVMSALVAEIISYARHSPGEAFEVCSQQQGVLEMRELDRSFPRVMPEDLEHAWLVLELVMEMYAVLKVTVSVRSAPMPKAESAWVLMMRLILIIRHARKNAVTAANAAEGSQRGQRAASYAEGVHRYKRLQGAW